MTVELPSHSASRRRWRVDAGSRSRPRSRMGRQLDGHTSTHGAQGRGRFLDGAAHNTDVPVHALDALGLSFGHKGLLRLSSSTPRASTPTRLPAPLFQTVKGTHETKILRLPAPIHAGQQNRRDTGGLRMQRIKVYHHAQARQNRAVWQRLCCRCADYCFTYLGVTPCGQSLQFGSSSASLCVTPLRTAGRLRQDFDLDLFTVAMLLGYLHRIEVLENELRCLQAGQPPASVAIAGEFRTLV